MLVLLKTVCFKEGLLLLLGYYKNKSNYTLFSLCSVHHFLAKRNELIPITRIKGNACCRSVKIHKFTDPSVDSRS